MIITDWRDEILGIRKAEGLSWQDIADEMGITRQGVRGIVNGTHSMVPKSIVSLMEAMGYDIEINFIRKGLNKE